MDTAGEGPFEITERFDEEPLRLQTMSSVLRNRVSGFVSWATLYFGSDESTISTGKINPNGNLIQNDLEKWTTFLGNSLPGSVLPDRTQIVNELPTTELDKVEKYRLRQQLEGK